MAAMTYPDALAYLYSLTNYERSDPPRDTQRALDLERMRAVLAALGNPHERYKTIHVAGTKGKGSTAAMIDACLRQLGLRVGLFTSPHLTTFRERIRVNGALISQEEVVDLTQRMQSIAEHIPGITTFEAVTAMGFLYFAQRDVDWAVIEVGLGGRLDATNVITPQVSVITSISLDHTRWLGNTLAEIAAEKAGIIKPGVPVVSQQQATEAMAVIERTAHERNAPLAMLGRHWRWTPGLTTLEKQTFEVKQVARVRSNERPYVNDLEGWYETTLLGKHQCENATTAIAALDVLRNSGSIDISARAIRDGLRATFWPGRFEILRAHPPLILDGAHNVDSVNKLAMTLAEVFPGRRWTFIFGCYQDKDAEGMLKALAGRAVRWIMTQPGNSRAMPVEQLLDIARARNLKTTAFPTVKEAMNAVANTAEAVCITGSIALVGEARAAWGIGGTGAGIDVDPSVLNRT
ncbi:MAG: folylpolyglutamate synthase/dihydrofolate synthase family protein [Anaerolineae bacterium]|nr:bifunctional folylpolyglutamate synthase/dihydrofolate synthase [Thermoflexales bacterium]MDW8406306.1 folylpolyglutamate synthase/dihydrofolate synthase family protein [Anaerolineae bacterium]